MTRIGNGGNPDEQQEMPPVQKKSAIEQFTQAEWSEVERGHRVSWRRGARKVCVLYQELSVNQTVLPIRVSVLVSRS